MKDKTKQHESKEDIYDIVSQVWILKKQIGSNTTIGSIVKLHNFVHIQTTLKLINCSSPHIWEKLKRLNVMARKQKRHMTLHHMSMKSDIQANYRFWLQLLGHMELGCYTSCIIMNKLMQDKRERRLLNTRMMWTKIVARVKKHTKHSLLEWLLNRHK